MGGSSSPAGPAVCVHGLLKRRRQLVEGADGPAEAPRAALSRRRSSGLKATPCQLRRLVLVRSVHPPLGAPPPQAPHPLAPGPLPASRLERDACRDQPSGVGMACRCPAIAASASFRALRRVPFSPPQGVVPAMGFSWGRHDCQHDHRCRCVLQSLVSHGMATAWLPLLKSPCWGPSGSFAGSAGGTAAASARLSLGAPCPPDATVGGEAKPPIPLSPEYQYMNGRKRDFSFHGGRWNECKECRWCAPHCRTYESRFGSRLWTSTVWHPGGILAQLLGLPPMPRFLLFHSAFIVRFARETTIGLLIGPHGSFSMAQCLAITSLPGNRA